MTPISAKFSGSLLDQFLPQTPVPTFGPPNTSGIPNPAYNGQTNAMRGFSSGFYTGGPGGGLGFNVGPAPDTGGPLAVKGTPKGPMPAIHPAILQWLMMQGNNLFNPGGQPNISPGGPVLPTVSPFPFQGGFGGFMPPPPIQSPLV